MDNLSVSVIANLFHNVNRKPELSVFLINSKGKMMYCFQDYLQWEKIYTFQCSPFNDWKQHFSQKTSDICTHQIREALPLSLANKCEIML